MTTNYLESLETLLTEDEESAELYKSIISDVNWLYAFEPRSLTAHDIIRDILKECDKWFEKYTYNGDWEIRNYAVYPIITNKILKPDSTKERPKNDHDIFRAISLNT